MPEDAPAPEVTSTEPTQESTPSPTVSVPATDAVSGAETPSPSAPAPAQVSGTAEETTTPAVAAPAAEGALPESYSSAFEGYDQDEINGLLNLVSTIRDNPTTAAEMLQNLAQALVAGEEDGGGATPELPAGTSDDVKTQFETWYAEKQQAAAAEKAQAEAVQALDTRIDELGYGRGTDEAPAIDRAALLMLAHDSFAGDIDKAHAAVGAWKQQIIDEALAPSKAAKAKFAPVEANSGGGAEPGKKKVSSFEEAAENFRKRLGQ